MYNKTTKTKKPSKYTHTHTNQPTKTPQHLNHSKFKSWLKTHAEEVMGQCRDMTEQTTAIAGKVWLKLKHLETDYNFLTVDRLPLAAGD